MTEIYLSNKDLLEEIFLSKLTYCEFENPKFERYDYILDLEDLENSGKYSGKIDERVIFKDPQIVLTARANRADRLSLILFQKEMEKFDQGLRKTKPKAADYRYDESLINLTDLVFRVHTYEHIPLRETKKKTVKRRADEHTKVNFVPFKHYVIDDLNAQTLREVGRSHTYRGEFCITHGQMTDRMAHMLKLITERYAQKGNWRGYTYVDEMQGQALLQLAMVALQFNEFRSDNPFSYFTAILSNSFTRILNVEKKNQKIRDDLLESMGMNPSFTRQLEYDEAARVAREDREASASNEVDDSLFSSDVLEDTDD